MRDFLVGQINRWKNYARWSWVWYQLHPYRNTLISVLLLVITCRDNSGASNDIAAAERRLAEIKTDQSRLLAQADAQIIAAQAMALKEPLLNTSKAKFQELFYAGFTTEKGDPGFLVLVPTEYNDFCYVERLSMQVAIEKSARQHGLVGNIGLMWSDSRGRTHGLSPHALGDRLLDQDGERYKLIKDKATKSFKLTEYPSQDEIDSINRKRFDGDI